MAMSRSAYCYKLRKDPDFNHYLSKAIDDIAIEYFSCSYRRIEADQKCLGLRLTIKDSAVIVNEMRYFPHEFQYSS